MNTAEEDIRSSFEIPISLWVSFQRLNLQAKILSKNSISGSKGLELQ